MRAEYFTGSGALVASHEIHYEVGTGLAQGDFEAEPVSLNFDDADIRDVTRAVLGDILQVNYVVAEEVKGQITLKSSQPLPYNDVFDSFQDALQLYGYGLINKKGAYHLVKSAKLEPAAFSPRVLSRADPNIDGYGVYLVPLNYISAQEAEQVLRPFAPKNGILRVDTVRNLLILSGSRGDMEKMLDTISTFDVDWLQGMSFAMFYPAHVRVAQLERELAAVFDSAKSPVSGLVQLIPIPRLNALLAVSPKRVYLRHVETWIKRFDRPISKDGRRIFYYRLQNAKAEDIEAALSQLLTTAFSDDAAPDSEGAAPALPILQDGEPPPTIVTDCPSSGILGQMAA